MLSNFQRNKFSVQFVMKPLQEERFLSTALLLLATVELASGYKCTDTLDTLKNGLLIHLYNWADGR